MSGNSGNNARDNRQRGNAAQLLEKYKNLARDAQLAGDRVQTEYYLQFADHYFRVLEDNRSRYEDQQPQRRRRDEDDDEVDGDEELMVDGGDDEGEPEPRQEQRPRREEREPREAREPREQRYRDRSDRPRTNGADRSDDQEPRDERIALGVLPPAIGADSGPGSDEAIDEEAPRPRRRTVRKPRTDDGDGTAAA